MKVITALLTTVSILLLTACSFGTSVSQQQGQVLDIFIDETFGQLADDMMIVSQNFTPAGQWGPGDWGRLDRALTTFRLQSESVPLFNMSGHIQGEEISANVWLGNVPFAVARYIEDRIMSHVDEHLFDVFV